MVYPLYNANTHRHTSDRAECLEDTGTKTLPRRPGLHLLAFAVDEVPVKLTAASVNIHLGGPEPASALPEVSGDPESNDDEESKVGAEEVLSGTNPLANGRDGSVELWGISL